MSTCSGVAELAPAYALDALDDGERSEVDSHLAACPTCRDLLVADEGVAHALALAAPQRTPPSRVRARLMTAVREERREPRVPLWRRLFPAPLPTAVGAASVATLAFVVSLSWGIGLQSRIAAAPTPAAATSEYEWAIARAQMHRLAGSETAPEARGWIYVDPTVDEALLVAYKLPPLRPGLTYQLWLLEDGQRVSGGTFEVDEEGYGWLKVKSPKAIGAFDRVGVTVEPAKGSEGPTGARVLGGQL